MSTARDYLVEQGVDFDSWPAKRKAVAEEQYKYLLAGIEVGKIDGFTGPQTAYAKTVYDAKQTGNTTPATWRDTVEPTNYKAEQAKWPTQSNMTSFYGQPGTNQVNVTVPFDMVIAWNVKQKLRTFQCHKLVKEPMEYIWNKTLEKYGYDNIVKLKLHYFGGCLNVRKMRGGSAWSMHAWGTAYDVDPERNALHMNREQATLARPEYNDFWHIVYSTGAISLGRERNFDWMHFQWSRLG